MRTKSESDSLWRQIPPLFWFYDARRIKPGAETLMEAPAGDELVPLIVHQRYGAGQILYMGTDETWRWRKLPGGEYHRRLWSQIVTQTGLDHVMAEQGKGRVQIETASREAALGSETTVMATVLGIDHRPLDAEQIDADSGFRRRTRGERSLWRRSRAARASSPDRGPPRPWASTGSTSRISKTRANGMSTSSRPRSSSISRRSAPICSRSWRTRSGGRYVSPADIDGLGEILSDLKPLVRAQLSEKPVWNAPGLLLLIAMLFGLELVLRKRWDLL